MRPGVVWVRRGSVEIRIGSLGVVRTAVEIGEVAPLILVEGVVILESLKMARELDWDEARGRMLAVGDPAVERYREWVRRGAILETLGVLGVESAEIEGLDADGILVALRDRTNWRAVCSGVIDE